MLDGDAIDKGSDIEVLKALHRAGADKLMCLAIGKDEDPADIVKKEGDGGAKRLLAMARHVKFT